MENLNDFKSEYPDLYAAIYAEGKKAQDKVSALKVKDNEDGLHEFDRLVMDHRRKDGLSFKQAYDRVRMDNPQVYEDWKSTQPMFNVIK